VPRRLGVPLIEEIEEVDPDRARERQADARIPLELERGGRIEQIGNVHFPLLQHGGAGGRLRHALEHQALDRRHLAPVALAGLHDDLDAGGAAHELVRPQTDRVLLEAVVADLLDVLLGHDPARRGRERSVEGHEVGERLVEMEPDPIRIDDLDLAHLLLEDP